MQYDWDRSFSDPSCGTVPSLDGRLLVSGTGSDLRVGKLATGSDDMIVTDAHDTYITRVAISPDARMICSGSEDGSVKLWRVPRRNTNERRGRKHGGEAHLEGDADSLNDPPPVSWD